jgi:septum site-determining protein MinC
MSNEPLTVNNENNDKKQTNFLVKDLQQQIVLKKQNDLVIIILPPENKRDSNQWDYLLDQFQSRLQAMEKEWASETKVSLWAKKRLLDSQQLQTIAKILQEVNLKLDLIVTSRRQTAVAAASCGYSVQQESEGKPLIKKTNHPTQILADPLYLKNTIRSGTEIRHSGTVIVWGDVNPGGIIIAGGDVCIWGNLRGIAHAGAEGNRKSLIMALKMNATQSRIATMVATCPHNLPEDFEPEVAYISNQGIKITSAFNFSKTNFFSQKVDSWTELNYKSSI